MIRRLTILAFTYSLLTACAQPTPDSSARCQYDQDVRRDIFMECLRVVPQGPVATRYNDWSEVVKECGSQAEYISLRGCSNTRAKDSRVEVEKP
jgi:hypothetical protein